MLVVVIVMMLIVLGGRRPAGELGSRHVAHAQVFVGRPGEDVGWSEVNRGDPPGMMVLECPQQIASFCVPESNGTVA
jgi:hypothetical protein